MRKMVIGSMLVLAMGCDDGRADGTGGLGGDGVGGSGPGGSGPGGSGPGGSGPGGSGPGGSGPGGDGVGGSGPGGSGPRGDSLGVVFKNVNIVPMTSEIVLEGLSVYVSNGRIEAIDSFEALSVPDGATIIDGTGKYLTPGFSDMHIHFSAPSLAQQLKLYLANGVTTVRNMWGFPAVLSAREAIENGDVLGPRVYTTGPIVDGPGGRLQGSFILADVSDVELAITEMKDEGYGYIKVYDDLSVEVYDEILRVSKGIDISVVGHVPSVVGVDHAIESGLFSIEHFAQYYLQSDDGLDEQRALTVESGIWNCPTLIVLNAYEDLEAARTRVESLLKYVDPDEVSSWAWASDTALDFSDRTALLHDLYGEGANIVSGTDVGNPYIVSGFSLPNEFVLMQASGLSPYEVLLTTTVNAARMLGVEERRGTVEPGKDADLVLLEKNPLENIDSTRSIVGVMTRGEWLSQEKIQSMLDEVEGSFSEAAGGPSTDYGCFETLVEPVGFEWPSSEHPYQACSEAVGTGQAPVIADFDDCSSDILPNEGRTGFWYGFNDGSNGTFTIDVESGAAHITSSNWSNSGAGIACTVGPVLGDLEHCSYDASHYAGVRVRAKGSGDIRFAVGTVANVAVDDGGPCDREASCYDWPGQFATLTEEWETIEFPFCTMTPEGWGGEAAPLDPAEIVELQLRLNAGQDFDFWIDDIAFFTAEDAEASFSCETP